MRQLTVLMYHAIIDMADATADLHYAVSRSRFREQIRLIRDRGMRLCSVRDVVLNARDGLEDECVALTFDDGHASNLDAAMEIFQNGGKADFFINPDTIGRENYLTWPALREMAVQGMSIQSHGYTHRYLDSLPVAEVENELVTSKKEIEDRLGLPVTLFAPAGGRMPRGFIDLARRTGYSAVCTSRPGTWKPGSGPEIARLPVMAGTPDVQIDRWIVGSTLELLKQRARYRVLRVMKEMLGNHLYEKIRGGILGQTR
jgi:peptidoglycan/xylan/chitin deacetylase (PgdA/CDA1 family)